MSRFQQGSVFKLKRKGIADVWVFRWYENTSGKRTYKKQIIGERNQTAKSPGAKKTVIALRSSINAEVGTPKTVCDLAAHYRLHELTRERKAFSAIGPSSSIQALHRTAFGKSSARCSSYHGGYGMAALSSVSS